MELGGGQCYGSVDESLVNKAANETVELNPLFNPFIPTVVC
jgi:hypothetical protein